MKSGAILTRYFLLRETSAILDYLDSNFSRAVVLSSSPSSKVSTTLLQRMNLWEAGGLSCLSVTELMELLVALRTTLNILIPSPTSSSVSTGTVRRETRRQGKFV